MEVILKGLEIALPEGAHFFDKDQNLRRHIRSRWWQAGATTFRQTAIVPPEVLPTLPDRDVPADLLPGYDGKKPLFLGHYWLKADKPVPLTDHIACLDYSVASQHVGKDNHRGELVAYRWQGEQMLTPEHFAWVS